MNPTATQELRARANSAGARSVGGGNGDVNNRLFVSSTTAEEIAQAQSSTQQLRLMGGSDLDRKGMGFQRGFYYAYKREMSHRLVRQCNSYIFCLLFVFELELVVYSFVCCLSFLFLATE